MAKRVSNRGWCVGVVVVWALGLSTGCAGSQPEAETASAGGGQLAPNYGGSRIEAESLSYSNEAPLAPAPEAEDYDAPSFEESYQESSGNAGAYKRPGLATQWGEERQSQIQETYFERQRAGSPFAQVAIRYDDDDGVQALTGMDDRYAAPGLFQLAGGALTVSLNESDGDPWPALTSGGKHFVIGDEGDRYSIHITNHTPGRFEVVASVDGLDVMDGRDAEVSKRGYIVAPWGSLDIEGFRSSTQAVQAFRFGEVQDSYAVARGRGADVGVVGVAVFEERGFRFNPRSWNRDHAPNPFPGRFAPAPGN